jgi:hypothetical protein
MISFYSMLSSSLFLGLGIAHAETVYNSDVCITYNNSTYNTSYSYSDQKIKEDFVALSRSLLDYYGAKDFSDCVKSCAITINLVSRDYLNKTFNNWTTGTLNNGHYELQNRNSSTYITGLYTFDFNAKTHAIYLTDTGSSMHNYGIFSHELAHYWFKRKCFNEGYYNEMNAINFHKYIMNNYKYITNNPYQ